MLAEENEEDGKGQGGGMLDWGCRGRGDRAMGGRFTDLLRI